MTSSSLTEKRTWDYAASVARVRPLVMKWGQLTIEMLGELHAARRALASQGARTDLTSGQMSRSWDSYCSDVGLEKRTANRWLLRYDADTRTVKELPEPTPIQRPAPRGREQEETQETVVDAEPVESGANGRTKRPQLAPDRKAKVDEFKARMAREDAQARNDRDDQKVSGKETEDLLRRIDDQILRMQEAAQRFSHLTLSGGSDDMVQASMLDLLQRYVASFETATRRVEVAHNLIKALRVLVHEINGEEGSA